MVVDFILCVCAVGGYAGNIHVVGNFLLRTLIISERTRSEEEVVLEKIFVPNKKGRRNGVVA